MGVDSNFYNRYQGSMNLRDILTLLGAVFLAVGPSMMLNAPNQTLFWIGQVVAALGGALTGARAVMKDPDKTPPPAPSTVTATFSPPATGSLSGPGFQSADPKL